MQREGGEGALLLGNIIYKNLQFAVSVMQVLRKPPAYDLNHVHYFAKYI